MIISIKPFSYSVNIKNPSDIYFILLISTTRIKSNCPQMTVFTVCTQHCLLLVTCCLLVKTLVILLQTASGAMVERLRPDELASFREAFDTFDRNSDGTISTKVDSKYL